MSVFGALSRRQRLLLKILVAIFTIIVIVAAVIWYKFFREVPQHFASQEEYFKYGSIGTEEQEGMPYWIWLVLPRMFPEYLPESGGYHALGVAWEEGSETPVGFSKRTIGFPRIGINCALCHSATYRTSPTAQPQIVPTGPTVRFDLQGYLRFMSSCASDPRFTAKNILREIDYNVKLSWFDRQLYRYVIIPRTREALLRRKQRFLWTNERPPWGRGRIDPFNPVKYSPHVLKLSPQSDDTIGNSDIEPLWKMTDREGVSLHWDGLNTSLTEVVLSGAVGDGATPKSLPVAKLKGLESYLQAKEPPPYPFDIDDQLAMQGADIFAKHCADCHGREGSRFRKVIPLREIGTDRHRLDMWTQEATRRYNNYAAGYDWDFDAFVKTDGYVAVPLDGLWLRAPYLHNGSVPTLEALLQPLAERPTIFYRGYDVYVTNGTGFIHEGPEAELHGFRYDTKVDGNGNQGHDYGTDLLADEKRSLIEYLKTL
jgi:hypothetical protein